MSKLARKLRLSTALLGVVALSMLLIAPASADQAASNHREAPGVGVCEGLANVDPGLGLPGTETSFDWDFNTTCEVTTVQGGVESANLSASGTGSGACFLSNGQGTWELTFADGQTVGGDVQWAAGSGGVLPLTGTHDAGATGTLTGVAHARPENPDDCLNSDASSFSVTVEANLS